VSYQRDAEIKLLERVMDLIERAFKLFRQMDEREEQAQLNQKLYLERKQKYEVRKLKKEKKENDVCN